MTDCFPLEKKRQIQTVFAPIPLIQGFKPPDKHQALAGFKAQSLTCIRHCLIPAAWRLLHINRGEGLSSSSRIRGVHIAPYPGLV